MENPLFSIIIPTYNRPNQLAICLESIAQLNYPRERYEVIVVNDGGMKLPDELLNKFKGQFNILLINQANSGPASARNNGAKIANGEFLAFTDDDCLSEPAWLNSFENILRKYSDCMVGGKTLNKLCNNLYSTASQMICDIAYRHYNENHESASFFCTNNLALSKRKFLEIGGFDDDFKTAEDRDLCKRWQKHGLRMIFAPEAIIYHAHDLTLYTFAKQHFNYGRGSFQFYNKNLHGPGYFNNIFRFNFNPENLVFYPLSKHKGFRGLSLVILMFFWQFTNATGFFYELINHKLKLPKLLTEK